MDNPDVSKEAGLRRALPSARQAPGPLVSAAGGGTCGRSPVRVAAYIVSALGAFLGPACLIAFPGPGSWTARDLREAWVLVPAALLMASPFAAFLLAARLSRTRAGAGVVLALTIVATLFGALFYVDAALRKDFVLLLASVGVPAVQWLIALPALVAAIVLRGRGSSSSR